MLNSSVFKFVPTIILWMPILTNVFRCFQIAKTGIIIGLSP